jgi:hypothetical protein
MTIVLIENIAGSGQLITVQEDFGHHLVEHRLRPGDNVRIAVSRFKSIIVKEYAAKTSARPVAFRRAERRPAAVAA